MTRVLFIAFEFPPLSNTGVHRSAKFVKYLRGCGVEPIVLTLDADDASHMFTAPLDPQLMDDVPPGTTVCRVSCPVPKVSRSRWARAARIFFRFVEDIAARARPALDLELPALMRRYRPDVVYVSMPPFSAGPLAADIARRYALPLVVDMRDGWSHWCSGSFPTYLHFREVLRREGRLFRQAHTVVTVTEQLAAIFHSSHPSLPATRFAVVPNGFDGELPTWSVAAQRTDDDRPFVIGYSGSFYYSPETRAVARTPWWQRHGHRKLHYQPTTEDWLYRSPAFFFRALAELRRSDPATGRRVRFQYVGDIPSWWTRMVADHDLVDVVTCVGRVPLAEAQALSARADANLCTSVKVVGGDDYALASKTFDYVKAGRPILGLVTRGAQRDFLLRSGVAVVADPDDLGACVTALRQLIRGEVRFRRNDEFILQYRRSAAAAALANIFHTAARLEVASSPIRP